MPNKQYSDLSLIYSCCITLLQLLCFLRHRPIPQNYKTITEEYRWAAGGWWCMLLLLLSALVNAHTHFPLSMQDFKPLNYYIYIQNSIVVFTYCFSPQAILQKSLDNFDLSIKVIYIVGTLSFSIGQFQQLNANSKIAV